MSSSRRLATFAPAAMTSAPVASHSPRSTGSGELVIVTTTSCAPASRWLSPASAPDELAERGEPLGRSAVGDDALDRRHGSADARDLGLGLVAAAEHAERSGPVTGQVASCDPARRPRAQPAELVGLDHGGELGLLGVEEADDEGRSGRRCRVELAAGEPELAIGRRHVRERSFLEPQATPWRVVHGTPRDAPEALLDRLDGVGRLEERGDVGFGEVERHDGEV